MNPERKRKFKLSVVERRQKGGRKGKFGRKRLEPREKVGN